MTQSDLLGHVISMGFPDSSVGKESTCSAGDCSSIPGSGRSAGEGKGYPLQYSQYLYGDDYNIYELKL